MNNFRTFMTMAQTGVISQEYGRKIKQETIDAIRASLANHAEIDGSLILNCATVCALEHKAMLCYDLSTWAFVFGDLSTDSHLRLTAIYTDSIKLSLLEDLAVALESDLEE